MREVTLTRGKVALVDDEDYELVMQHNWFANPSRFTWYAVTYAYPNGVQTKLQMHNLIVKGGLYDGGLLVDHIDCNGLNNQRANLHEVSHSFNKQNGPAYVNNRTGYKGVYPFQGKFCAQVRKDRRKYYLGSFATPEEAALAYDLKALELYGPHASLNFSQVVRG